MHIFLTGEKHIGKSTVLQTWLRGSRLKIGGFLTVRAGVNSGGANARRSVHLIDLSDNRSGAAPAIKAALGTDRPGGELFETLVQFCTDENRLFYCGEGGAKKSGVTTERFNELGVRALQNSRNADLIIMDEIGPNEEGAKDFQDEVLLALDGNKPVIGVLQDGDYPFRKKVADHGWTKTIRVTQGNRDALAAKENNPLAKIRPFTFWSEEMIRFMQNAAEYHDFQAELAEHIAKYFHQSDHICDIGCGLGDLSLGLLPHVGHVTAIDTDPVVLQILREKAEKRSVLAEDGGALTILQADVFDLPSDQKFDGMTACFFGQMPFLLDFIRKHCDGNAVLIRKNWDTHRFASKDMKIKRLRFEEDCRFLEEAGVPYHAESIEMDMGQPFTDFADACAFFRLYSRTEEAMSEDRIRELLQPIEHEKFSWYFPSVRKVGVIVTTSVTTAQSIC